MSNTAIRLPDGKIQVLESTNPSMVKQIFESEAALYERFQAINEGKLEPFKILDSING